MFQDMLLQEVADRCELSNIYWTPTTDESKTLKPYERFVVVDVSGIATPEAVALYLPEAMQCKGKTVHVRAMVAIGSSGAFVIHSNLGDTTDVNLSGITAQHEDVAFISDGLSWQIICTDGSR